MKIYIIRISQTCNNFYLIIAFFRIKSIYFISIIFFNKFIDNLNKNNLPCFCYFFIIFSLNLPIILTFSKFQKIHQVLKFILSII